MSNYVYIMTNWSNKVLYTGCTNDIGRRIYEHKNKMIEGFTLKYNTTKLVYFESAIDTNSAYLREKQIKGWSRKKKIELIEKMNPGWRDLSEKFQMLNKIHSWKFRKSLIKTLHPSEEGSGFTV